MDTQDCAGSSVNDTGTDQKIDPSLAQESSPAVLGYIYFIQAAGSIKIGFSRHPLGRLGGLQTGNAEDLVLLGRIRGTYRDEKELHRMFCHLQIRREWFRAEEELIDYIKSAVLDEEWQTSRPVPSPEAAAAIKKLVNRRACCGAETAAGYRLSNLIEQVRSYDHATGDQAAFLTKAIDRQMSDLQRLA